FSNQEVQWSTPENHAPVGASVSRDADIAWTRPQGSDVPFRAIDKCNLESTGKRVVHFRWRNYSEAVKKIPFWLYARNTLWLCILSVFGVTLSSAIVAYGFSRIQWPGRDKVFLIVLATMMIPFPVIMIP